MNIHDAKKSIDITFKSRKTFKLLGGSGIGKSEIAEQHAKAEQAKGDYFFSTLNAATANLAQVMGFMIPIDATVNGKTFKRGTFTYPYYFIDDATMRPAFTFERGLIRIEEWGQASGEVKRALATLVHERRMGEHILPSGFDIIILSNRPEDRSGVGKEFDFLINRWNQQTLEPSKDPWIEYAIDNDISETSMAFAVQHAGAVFHGEVPKEQGPWCTPRSLVAADRFMTAALAGGWSVDDPLMTENLAGIIGEGVVSDYMSFIRLRHKLPRFEDIVARPDTAMMPSDMSALYLTVYALSQNVDQKTLRPVITYMKRAPAEFAITFIKAAVRKSPVIVNTKEYSEWVRGNVALSVVVADKTF